ncbi:MAG: hypothetical protein HS101_13850 [Planctomycetia bacterium]|jgi:hypothetical protein|nr:hypothetical protein [Planctomycetia bacterium]MCC7315909.1 hypothetical protein [Planctomycetota bacterium]OQZ06275.1 MAG: hypothetical protein B6D36_05870 [Planctomycetes bacterium UTPLA1]
MWKLQNTRRRLTRLIGGLAAFVLAVIAAIPTVVIAQINDPSVKPENIELLKTGQPVLEYALAGGFLLAALAVAFKPSKRGMEKNK